MKKILIFIAAMLTTMTVAAQTLSVQVGNVTYLFPAAQTGEMTYADGTTLTIMNKVFALSDITSMAVSDTEVTDNLVAIAYNGASATVTVAGNVAQYVEPTVSGAYVSINQSNTDAVDGDEITYQLSGTSSDGQFALSGAYKCTVSLAGVNLTCASDAAINITNKKRIQISAKKGTENTLADGSNGSQKGCIYSKGQIQLQGNGTLNVVGNTAHAIKSADYISVKNLTLNINGSVGDGINCNGYFQMKSGTVTIKGTGDEGIQCDLDGTTYTGETADHEDEDTGNIYIDGGTLSITTTAAGAKGLKADSIAYVNGGTLTFNCSGNVDTSDASDPSYVAAISAGKFVQNGGTITATIKGVAGRGVKAYDIVTNGGELTIANSATPTTISNDVKGAKGLKALNIALNAGTINITMSGNASKAIRCGDGTQTTSGGGWGGMGGSTKWSNVKGSYTQGLSDGTGPTLTINQTGSSYNSSSAKGIKAICAVKIYGGQTELYTKSTGGEGLESKTSIDIQGGKHYFQCYDDCINSAGKIFFNGGVTVCYSNGNDAVDSNAGTTGAITIGDGVVFAYTTKGAPEEGLDCDNNSYIQITGKGIGISAGANQGGGGGGGRPGGGWGGNSSSGYTISNAQQGYAFVTNTISYTTGRYYTLADASGKNLVTYSFAGNCSSSLALFTATGMVKNSDYNVKYSTSAPTDATTVWHGLYLGSSAQGTNSVTSFVAQ